MIRFQVGDKAVYPAQGRREIVGIDERDLWQDSSLLPAYPRYGYAHPGSRRQKRTR